MDVYRRLLRLYPKPFRDEYATAMRQAHADLRTHGGLRGPRLFLRTAGDLARSVGRLRMEEAMAVHPTRTRAIATILIATAFIALVSFGPLWGIPLMLILLVYMRRHADDIGPASQSQGLWLALPIVGGALILVGVIANVLGAGDNGWWPLAVGPAIIGCTLLVVTLVLGLAHEVGVRVAHRPPLVPARVRATSAAVAGGALVVTLVAMGEDRGWGIFMIGLISVITLATLGVYALLLRFTHPSGAAA